MTSSIKNDPKSMRDIAYYEQRFRNRVFSSLVSFIHKESEKRHLTQKDIAERIRKDPALISRLLSAPGNLTLDTISDLLLAFDAEAEPPEIVFFKDRRESNYIHPLMARTLGVVAVPASKSTTSNVASKIIAAPKKLDIKFSVSAG